MSIKECVYRDGLKTILKRMGRSKVRFHAFRRFRQAVLEKSDIRQILIDYWMAHDDSNMSSSYAKQLTEDVEFRQEWAEKVGSASIFRKFSAGSETYLRYVRYKLNQTRLQRKCVIT